MSALLALILLFSQDPIPEKCALSGTVVDSVTGEPLGKAELRLIAASGPTSFAAATTTDQSGNFNFVGLDSGRFRLIGRRNGYLEMAYGALRPNAEGTVLQLNAAQTISNVKVKLMSAGVIAGVVRDADGEPLEGVSVTLCEMQFRNGQRRLEGTDSTDTDDRGEYRFRGLQPGKYFLNAEEKTGAWWNNIDFSGNRVTKEVSVPTYYPSVAEAKLAVAVKVGSGERVTGIDIKILRRPATRVRGLISGVPKDSVVNLTLAKSGDGLNQSLYRTVGRRTGEFEFRQVPEGNYRLTARGGGLAGTVEVQVGNAEVEGLRIALGPLSTIEAKITIEGENRPNFRGLSLWFTTVDSRNGSMCRFEASACVLHDLDSGNYGASWSPLPQGFYLKRMTAGNVDILHDGLEVSGGRNFTIELTVASDAASVSGTINDPDGRPVAGAAVLLTRQSHSQQERFHSTTADQFGRYEIGSIAPGEYRVFAWKDVEPGAWEDPEFLSQYEKVAVSFVAEPKVKATANVQLPQVDR